MTDEPKTKDLKIVNQIGELVRIEAFLEELGDTWGFPMPLVMSLNLVLEEAVTNIVQYGYDDTGEHFIDLIFGLEGDLLTITIIDDGHEYDPTAKEDPDITLPAGERPIGGLGIFLIRKIMDTVVYQRKANKNYLILTKKIES
jgi:serine/threonine-protein kinase RsbW